MKLWPAALVSSGLALFLSANAVGQGSSPSQAAILQKHNGVIVEKLADFSEGRRAGLMDSDVLVRWSRDDAHGEIHSPFELTAVEIEEAPRGKVILEGFRKSEPQTWVLGPDTWGIETRPDFSQSERALYNDGQSLADSGKLNDAVEKWRALARLIGDSPPLWSRSWLLFHLAKREAESRQWMESDQAFQQAVETIATAGSSATAQVERAWGKTFYERSDWPHAEEHFRRALAAMTEKPPESLIQALILDNLGDIAEMRGELIKASDLYQQALRIREKLAPESLVLALSLNNLGDVDFDRGDFPRSEERQKAALQIQEKLAPGSLGFASSLNKLGRVAFERDDFDQSEKYYRQALVIREKLAPDSLEVATSLNNLAVIFYHRSDLRQAEALYLQSLAIREKLAPDSLDVAASLNNLANVVWDRGDFTKAEQFYLQCLRIREKLAPGSLNVAKILNNLGDVAIDRDDLAKAEDYERRALAIQQKLAPESVWVARSLNDLGRIAERRRDYDRAMDYFRRSLALTEKHAPGGLDSAVRLDNLGFVTAMLGDSTGAENYILQALAIRQKLDPGSPGVARTLNNLGMTLQLRGDMARAEEYELQALRIREKIAPAGADMAWNLLRLGDLVQQQSNLDRAEQYYLRAVSIWDRLAPQNFGQAEALRGLGFIKRQRHQQEAANRFYQRALDALEGQTSQLGGTEQIRAAFRGQYEKYYQEYVDLLVEQQKTDLAFEVLERSRARTFLEALTSAHLQIHRGADPELLERERSLRERITGRTNSRIQLLGGKYQQQQIAELDHELGDLREEYDQLEAEIKRTSPNYAALTQPQLLSAPQIRELLTPDTLLLEYSLGEERSYVFAVAPDSISVYPLPSRAEIELLSRKVYDSLTARKQVIPGESPKNRQARWMKADRSYARFSRQLSQMVLGPVAAGIKGKRLVLISDGALQYMPFAALPVPNSSIRRPLIADHEIVNLPSASVLSALRQQQRERKPAKKAIAVLADPVFSTRDVRVFQSARRQLTSPRLSAANTSTLPAEPVSEGLLTRSVRDVGLELSRLPFTRREAEAIMSLAPSGSGLKAVDFKATLSLATSRELSQYRIVHFATHGLLDSRNPELSGLVWSLVDEHGQSRNGFLTLDDIYNLDLPADLVVLSACETGLGKEIRGEGLIGLTRGFMYAGASRVVASLWSVSDVATAELMRRFYSGMLHDHLPPAAALRRAQSQMSQQTRWKSPYYWAAFQIQGDWR